MAGSKEIRNKIKSVQNTRKITKAMEMVAASKMKKAQDRMRATRPYVEKAFNIAMHISKANTEYKHPFLVSREDVKRGALAQVTKQEPRHGRMVPIPDEYRSATGEMRKVEVSDGTWDYIYEPDARELLDGMMRRYMEAVVLQMVNENMASEQSARMVAMKAASDNAGKIITELQLIYNKTRQAGITKELSEIVGGAAAV